MLTTERSFGTSKMAGDPADFESEPDNMISVPEIMFKLLMLVAKLSEERTALKDALYAKEKELSEAIYKLKPGSRK